MRTTIFFGLLFLTACGLLWISTPANAQKPDPQDVAYRVPGNLPFLYDYNEAMQQAREDGRPLFVYFAGKTFAKLDQRYFLDPGVEELLDRMHRVYVPLTVRPDLFPRFQVHLSNPTFFVLNDREQCLARSSGWTQPKYFAHFLRKGLDNHDRYRHGEAWVERPEQRGDVPLAFEAPVDGRVSGMAVLEGMLWVLQKQADSADLLLGLDPIDGSVRTRTRLSAGLATGLTALEDHLYVLDYCWPRRPIVKFDPRTETVVDRLETGSKEKSCGAYAIAAHGEYLWVHIVRDGLYKVDRNSGTILSRMKICSDRFWIAGGVGMEHDGERLLMTAELREFGHDWTKPGIPAVLMIDPDTGRLLDFDRTDESMASLVLHGSDLLLADGERFGYNERGRRIRLYPDRVRIHLWAP